MSSYLLPIDLSGSVSLNPSFTEGNVTCILPSQSEAVYSTDFILLVFVYYAFTPNITWAGYLLDRFYNFLNCSCFPPHPLWFWNSQGTKKPYNHYCTSWVLLKRDKYFRAIKRLGMWYRWSKVGTLPFKKYYSVYCHQFHGIHAFSSSYSSVSVISYSYNLGDFVKDFYELSMILISYELEPGIK